MRVPHDQLQPDTLRRVIESFVNREGTDYGEHERDLEDKVADVMRQLDEGHVALTWDGNSETVNIVPIDRLDG